MGDQRVRIFALSIPLNRPFATANGTIVTRRVALVRVGPEPYGWGEAAPYPGQDEPIEDVLRAADVREWTPTLSAAVDGAEADRDARIAGESLAGRIGATQTTLPVSLAIGMEPDPVAQVASAVASGVGRFKVKIAPGRVDHVTTIRERFRDVVLGVDANGSFDAETVSELGMLAGLGIAFVEQPVSDLTSDAARQLKTLLDAPVFADEAVRSVADAARLLESSAVDGIVIKPGRLGWTGALEARELANAAEKRWRASGLLETGIGRAFTDTLAACPDAFVSDVAPAEWFLSKDVTASRLRNAHITVPRGPGLGVVPKLS
ncbi:MAG: o-succinylbenzoate synthase [Acidimicrobiia bacterium]|nr:MAG: o-succinylbenzoate synthase [Acidimicrobiia bacterium]